MSNRLLLVLLGATLMLGSCNRKLLSIGSKANKTTVPMPESVRAANVDFRFLAAKGKAQFDQQSGNINVRIRKDSVIWISASLIGVEGGRIYITRDSVQVLDKLHREYYAGDFAYLSKRLNVPVNFDMLQALLLGNYLAPLSAATQPTVTTDGPVQRVNYEQAGLLVQQLVNLERGRIQQLQVQVPASENKLTVDYSDFRPLERTAQPFAHSSLVQVQQGQAAPSTLTITYRSVDVDKERLQFPFSVPKGYARKK
ncbi:DUF4292 domain-containing protein [Hymenobacter sp. 5516J-16]|uniref:DUF4292 domain-containing protein n=1 Tax=Hymenobacter sublimis TaxID=2933777 RepID=A0ABY4J722_9BACT|nr:MULTISPECIES: DUF4292 domain-containing protein [Hymenobacter]UOQ78643.1 DUF4292 domain-containing protein [Hymenobacter sp. 5516J-16]UPL48624.1 DUF4292 domain-containing protein [Hymenobacter sublimis]